MSNDNSDIARLYLMKTGIQALLDTPGVTEVAVNQPGRIWYEGREGWKFVDESAANFVNLKHLAESLSTYSNLPDLNQKNPIASVILPNGERGQIVIPPATESGCIAITIRKPSLQRFSINDYVSSGRFDNVKIAKKQTVALTDVQQELYELYQKGDPQSIEQFIYSAVNHRLNFLIVGGTGSGKTTIAKAVADIFPPERRYATIEDVHEMQLPLHPNHIHLFYKKGVVSAKSIIEACMRMKPDHIFLAELRGDEAWSYLEALNTGHEGSISTIHANNTYASFSRLANIVKQSEVGMTVDMELIMNTIKTSVDVIMFFNHTRLTEIYFEPFEKNRLLNLM
ncbi:P-type DNA transfer ATPase VirB11 [Salmonella enterica]|nr:P-type DNA transfer ATPase VirB11 [Salmonella enterica]